MSDSKLFDSLTKPIPQIRRDIQIIPVEQNGDSFLYFHDEQGYATPDFALSRQVESLLSLINGEHSIEDLDPYLGEGVEQEQILSFIKVLDKNRLLRSEYFEHHADKIEEDYEESTVHQSVTAGSSYPDDPEELKQFLNDAFSKHSVDSRELAEKSKALYAPHIDPRVALDSYVKAFAPLKNISPERVVIIATSHYAGMYPDIYRDNPFMLINKDFDLPNGTVKRDQEAISELKKHQGDVGITLQDRGHRMEHSIELHLLFLNHIWSHDFEIVPFLVRGLDDLYYMRKGHLGQQLEKFSALLNDKFANDEETFFLISGDLAHIGKKFGDNRPAKEMFTEVENFDEQFLEIARNAGTDRMLELMKEEMDPYRICGFPPLFTFLNLLPDVRGEVLSYDLWDESERESAVSFGSILFSRE